MFKPTTLKRSLNLSIILFVSLLIFSAKVCAQTTIVIPYNPVTNSFKLDNIPNKIQKGKEYTIIISQVNTAHTLQENEITASNFVSNIPDILRSIYPGIPDNTVGQNSPQFQKNTVYNRARKSYESLLAIPRISNALYKETKFNPNPDKATERKQELLQELGANSLAEVYTKVTKEITFLKSVERFYDGRIENDMRNNDGAVEFLEHYSEIKNMNEELSALDFSYLLNFIALSEQAEEELFVTKFTASEDIVEIDLNLYDTFTNQLLVTKKLSFDVYNSFSFDFSTGFFYTNLTEADYYTQLTDEGSIRIRTEDKSSADISIGALGHFTYKFLPRFRAGIALGASISPFDGKLRYLLGPSIILGRQDQLGLSFGLAISQINELSDAVLQEDGINILPSGAAGIPTVSKLQSGFFIGITYNLTNRKQP